jgi:hypothetical protein
MIIVLATSTVPVLIIAAVLVVTVVATLLACYFLL